MIAWLLLSLSAFAEPLAAPVAIIKLEGLDCAGCQPEVVEALERVPGVSGASASFAEGAACARLASPVEPVALRAALTKAGFSAASVEGAADCPVALAPAKLDTSPWDPPPPGMDARTVSRGEDVRLEDHLAPGMPTLFDFGAPWCAPCAVAAAQIQDQLRAAPTFAVRAVHLESRDAKAAFALPAAKRHLKWAAGLPWFVAYDAAGKRIYEGGSVEEALDALAKAPRVAP